MSDDDKLWHDDGVVNGWVMPTASRWKRLPVIRHFRAAYLMLRVDQWNKTWLALGKIPTGYDRWVIYGIARGYERHE